jgi:hypothetical protein
MLENYLVSKLRMRILGELTCGNDTPRKQPVGLALAKNIAHQLRVTGINAAQDAVSTDERLSRGVETNEAAHAA